MAVNSAINYINNQIFTKVKAVLIFLLCACLALATKAQNATNPAMIAGDTVINTATINKVISVTAGYSAVGIQPQITKISGTIAGTAKIQGTLNGITWIDIGSAFTLTDIAVNSTVFTISGSIPYTQLRLVVTGSGTMSGQLKYWYVLKRSL